MNGHVIVNDISYYLAQYNLKNDLSYENIVNYNNQKAIAEEFKFNSKIDALTETVAVHIEFLDSLQKSHKDLNTQVDNHSKSLQNLETTVNFHDESLESLISASKKIINEEVGAQEVNMQVDSHDKSDMYFYYGEIIDYFKQGY